MANGNPALVADSESGSPAAAMRAQARRLSAMADDLLALADCMDDEEVIQREPAELRDDFRLLAVARETYRDRRMRTKVFEDPNLFGESAWDFFSICTSPLWRASVCR